MPGVDVPFLDQFGTADAGPSPFLEDQQPYLVFPPVVFPSTGVLDDFNRTDENPVSQGGNWSGALRPGDASTLAVISNQLQKFDTVSFNEASRVYELTATDVEIYATVLTSITGALRLMLRVANAGTASLNGYMLELGGAALSVWTIRKVVSNVATDILGATNQAVQSGGKVAFQVIGSDLAAFYMPPGGPWRQVLTRNDTTYTGAGKVGISTNSPLTRFEDFSGGSLAVSGNVYAKTGALIGGTVATGADSFEAAETGALVSAAFASGADASEFNRSGALSSAARVAGADSFEASETGALSSGARLTGADSFQPAEGGALVSTARLSGADVATFSRSGALVSRAILTGARTVDYGRSGALSAGTRATAADVFEATESGALVSATALRGIAQNGFAAKTGALVSGAQVSGADQFTATESGALVSQTVTRGADSFEASEFGSLRSAATLSGTSTRISPSVYVKTGALVAAARLSGVSLRESATPTGYVESSSTTGGSEASAAGGSIDSRMEAVSGSDTGTEGQPSEAALVLSGVLD